MIRLRGAVAILCLAWAASSMAATNPTVKDCPQPERTKHSSRNEETGIALAQASVGKDGEVLSVQILISSGFKALDESVLVALQACTFNPARARGKAIAGTWSSEFNFYYEEDPAQARLDRASYLKKFEQFQRGESKQVKAPSAASVPLGYAVPLPAAVSKAAPTTSSRAAPPPLSGTATANGCGNEVEMAVVKNVNYCRTHGNYGCVEYEASMRKSYESYTDIYGKALPSAIQNQIDDMQAFQRSNPSEETIPLRLCVLKARLAQVAKLPAVQPATAEDAGALAIRASDVSAEARMHVANAASKPATGAGDAMANRTGRRQTYLHDHAALANHCVALDPDNKLYGGFKNLCNSKVTYSYCAFHPKKDTWADEPFFNCEKDMATKEPGVGALTMKAHGFDTEHTNGAERIYWFACTNGAQPEELHWNGSNIEGKCIHRWD